MKILGKIWLRMKLWIKSHKKQGITLSFENTFLDKLQGGGGQIKPPILFPSFLGLKNGMRKLSQRFNICFQCFFFCRQPKVDNEVAEIFGFYGFYAMVNYVYIIPKYNSIQILIYNILKPKVEMLHLLCIYIYS